VAVARGSLLVLALAACAWFALGTVQARDTDRAAAVLSSQTQLSSAAASHVSSLLRSAGTLNPDSTVDILNARLASLQHNRTRAQMLLRSVVAREPQNLDAWVALAQTQMHGDPKLLLLSVAHIARLDPRLK
jgi:hypothetical protein